MHKQFLAKETLYDGSQLRSGWIAEQTGLAGDAIVAFVGGAKVDATHMVDLEDIASEAWIASDRMLHFLVEQSDGNLERMILRQHLLMGIIGERLQQQLPDRRVMRRGDDLFFGSAKLSVSIATVSPTSALMHAGLNVLSTNTPVETIGLKELGIDPRTFGELVMSAYVEELQAIAHAATKVKTVY